MQIGEQVNESIITYPTLHDVHNRLLVHFKQFGIALKQLKQTNYNPTAFAASL